MNSESLCIIHALTILQQATSAELTDVEEAMELYVAASGYLSSISGLLSEEFADVARKNIEEIRLKIDNLRRIRWMKEQPKYFPEFQLQFVRIPIPVEDFVVPTSSFSRVFWLMRMLQLSMHKGAFFTKSLFVSKDVWHQDGNTLCLHHLGSKQRCFSTLSQAIQPINTIHSLGNSDEILPVLKNFRDIAEDQVKNLAVEMGEKTSLQPPKKDIWKAIQRSLLHTRADVKFDNFLASCSTLFEQCQCFERLHLYFSEGDLNDSQCSAIIDILTQISKILYSGPCIRVLRDMITLVDRYHHKSRKSVCSLLPVELKICVDQ